MTEKKYRFLQRRKRYFRLSKNAHSQKVRMGVLA